MIRGTEETLDALGIKFGTDKASSTHDYLSLYERFFQPIRHTAGKILEIGVYNGASLSVWEAYFPNATIIGADIDSSTTRFAAPRVQIEIIDQSNIENLVYLGLKYGPFDAVIEDGSHLWEHQITTLKTLFPFVRNGGVYIVEDLQTNYGNLEADYRGVSSISCVEYLKKLVDLRVSDDQFDISQVEDPFLRTYGRSMRTITFYRRACVIEKQVPPNFRLFSETPFVRTENDLTVVPTVVRAHIAHYGDRVSASGWLRSTPEVHFQAFAVETESEFFNCLSYRARLADGGWTNWKDNGELAGTQGKNQSLTGFSVRLSNAETSQFDLEVIGEFSGTPPETIIVRGGEDCVPPAGAGCLIGMQVVLRKR
jgi:hypothetical protein